MYCASGGLDRLFRMLLAAVSKTRQEEAQSRTKRRGSVGKKKNWKGGGGGRKSNFCAVLVLVALGAQVFTPKKGAKKAQNSKLSKDLKAHSLFSCVFPFAKKESIEFICAWGLLRHATPTQFRLLRCHR